MQHEVCAGPADWEAVTSYTSEPKNYADNELTIDCWVNEEDGSIYTIFNKETTRRFLDAAQNDNEKAQYKHVLEKYFEHIAPQIPRSHAAIFEDIKASVNAYKPMSSREKIKDHIESGTGTLLSIVDGLLQNRPPPFQFGPTSQKAERTDPGHRWICIFCHHLFQTASDLRRHLKLKHLRKGPDYPQAVTNLDLSHIDLLTRVNDDQQPNRLRIFGQYSYSDVKLNNWNIADWNLRKEHGSKSSEPSGKPSAGKRKIRDGGDEPDVHPRTPSRVLAPSGCSPTTATSSVNRGPDFSPPQSPASATLPPITSLQSHERAPYREAGNTSIDPRLLEYADSTQRETLAGLDLTSAMGTIIRDYDDDFPMFADDMTLFSPSSPRAT